MRRTLALILTTLAAVLFAPYATHAAESASVDLWIDDRWPSVQYIPTGTSNFGFNVSVRGDIPFGIQVEVIIDRSKLDSRVKTVPREPAECQTSANIVRCVTDMPMWNKAALAGLWASIASGAAPGPAGSLTVTVRPVTDGVVDPNISNNTMTGRVDIQNNGGADISFTAALVTGAVGKTVVMPLHVQNKGPNTQPSLSFTFGQGGSVRELVVVRADGCKLTDGDAFCTLSDLRKGDTRTIHMHVKINTCVTAANPRIGVFFYTAALNDPTAGENLVRFPISACDAPVPQGNSSAGDLNATSEGASATEISPSPLHTPMQVGTTAPAPSPSVAVAAMTPQRNDVGGSPWGWIAALLGLMLVAAAGGLFVLRRKLPNAGQPGGGVDLTV